MPRLFKNWQACLQQSCHVTLLMLDWANWCAQHKNANRCRICRVSSFVHLLSTSHPKTTVLQPSSLSFANCNSRILRWSASIAVSYSSALSPTGAGDELPRFLLLFTLLPERVGWKTWRASGLSGQYNTGFGEDNWWCSSVSSSTSSSILLLSCAIVILSHRSFLVWEDQQVALWWKELKKHFWLLQELSSSKLG